MDSPKINENLSQMQNFCDLFWIANEIPLCSRISVGIRRSRSSDSSIISWLCQSQLKAHLFAWLWIFPIMIINHTALCLLIPFWISFIKSQLSQFLNRRSKRAPSFQISMQPFARLHQLCLESVPALSPANNCVITFAQSGVTAQDSKYSAVLEKKLHWRGVFVHNGDLFIILA